MCGETVKETTHFTIVSPGYNVSKTCEQAIATLHAQSYKNWSLVYIDDCSTDDSIHCINANFYHDKSSNLTIIKNTEKRWEVANVLRGLKECSPHDVVVRLDLDDYLSDNDSFAILNELYSNDNELDAIWSSHRWFDSKGISGQNISAELPKGSDPYRSPWVSSHLKTFRRRVLNNVPHENFLGEDKTYIKRAGDRAIYLPALTNSRKWLHMPLCMYSYRCEMTSENFNSPDARFQASEAAFLSRRGYVTNGETWETKL